MNPLAVKVWIEPAGEADLPNVRALAESIWRSSYAGLLSAGQIEYMLDQMYSPERLLQDWTSGVVFERPIVDGVPVGYMATQADATTQVMHLHKLYVLPEFQGKGLGGRLLEHAFQSATRVGCRSVRLHVNKGNHRAIACYRRHGFVEEASVVNDIGDGYVMDDYVMVRPLDTHQGQSGPSPGLSR
jgi:ribosomal protein S18 acetylase RimI-like enzyme